MQLIHKFSFNEFNNTELSRPIDLFGTSNTTYKDVDDINIYIASILQSFGISAIYEERESISSYPFLWINDIPYLFFRKKGSNSGNKLSFSMAKLTNTVTLIQLNIESIMYLTFCGNLQTVYFIRFFGENFTTMPGGLLFGNIQSFQTMNKYPIITTKPITIYTMSLAVTSPIDSSITTFDYKAADGAIYTDWWLYQKDIGDKILKVPLTMEGYMHYPSWMYGCYKVPSANDNMFPSFPGGTSLASLYQTEFEINGRKYWVTCPSVFNQYVNHLNIGLVSLENNDPLITQQWLMGNMIE